MEVTMTATRTIFIPLHWSAAVPVDGIIRNMGIVGPEALTERLRSAVLGVELEPPPPRWWQRRKPTTNLTSGPALKYYAGQSPHPTGVRLLGGVRVKKGSRLHCHLTDMPSAWGSPPGAAEDRAAFHFFVEIEET